MTLNGIIFFPDDVEFSKTRSLGEPLQHKARGMVRDTGFEPVTPTVSR